MTDATTTAVTTTWFQNLITRHAGRLGFAVGFLAVGFLLAKWLRYLLQKAFIKFRMDPHLAGFLSKAFYAFCVTVLLVTFFSILGMPIASFVAIFGSLLLAVGIALKDDLAQVASGILIMLFRPYRLGDYVIMGSFSGTVTEISFFTTKLLGIDGQIHIIPNSKMTNEVVTNISAQPHRRMSFTIAVSMEADLDQAKAIIQEVFREESRILEEKGQVIAIKSWEKNAVSLGAMAWTAQEDYWSTSYDVLEKLVRRFQQEKIPMAADLWTETKSGPPKKLEEKE